MTAVRRIEQWQDIVPYLLAVDGYSANLATGMPLLHPELLAQVRSAYGEALAREDVDRRLGQYHGVLGDAVLRDRLATLYGERFSLPITESEVLITPGAQSVFHSLSELIARRGKSVLFFGPEYPGYRTHPNLKYEMVPSVVRGEGDHGFRYLPPLGAVGAGVGAVFVSRPSNPAGNVIDDELITALARECAEAGALLVLDNAYAPIIPGLSFREMGLPWGENVVLVQSFSKAALAGERIGFVIAPRPIVAELAAMQAQISTFPPQLVQSVVSILLSGTRYVELCETDLRDTYRARHELIGDVLQEHLDVPYLLHASDGGQFRWLHLPELRASTSELFYELERQGVLIAPSAPFYLPNLWDTPHASSSLRIGVTEPPESIEHGLKTLAGVLNHGW